MDQLRIRAVSLPVHCSVCHKSDQFDSVNNYCSRCDSYTLTQSANKDYLNDKPNRTGYSYLESYSRNKAPQSIHLLDNVVTAISVVTAIMLGIPPALLVTYFLVALIDFFTFTIDLGFRLNVYGEFIASVVFICFAILVWGLFSIYLVSTYKKFINKHFPELTIVTTDMSAN
jgi:hypothetical protein